jgi:glucose/mannose transport system substrate-binding protein
MLALAGKDTFYKVFKDKDADMAAGPEMAKVFKAADDARRMSKGTNVQDWNQATNMVITGKAGGQIMGDWAQGEFALAGQVAGKDYSCLPGLGVTEVIATGGDAFYFPLLKDEEKSKAQEVLASTLLAPATQVAFNLKKGSLPVRGDVDLAAANDCMKKGLDILAKGNVIEWTDQLLSADTQKQKEDLFSEFFANPSLTPEDAQKRFAEIIASAD